MSIELLLQFKNTRIVSCHVVWHTDRPHNAKPEKRPRLVGWLWVRLATVGSGIGAPDWPVPCPHRPSLYFIAYRPLGVGGRRTARVMEARARWNTENNLSDSVGRPHTHVS